MNPSMRRGVLILVVIVVVAAVASRIQWRRMIIQSLLPPPLPAAEMYPPAPPMPPVVQEGMDRLLAKYERILAEHAPKVLATLQPGLTNAQIDALEAAHRIKLTPDLRSLYRWRNGTPRAAYVDVFPDHEFVPLDQALQTREALRRHRKSESPELQELTAPYVGHRDAWLGLIVDLAGDGCFFDPERSEAEGSFFFCFAEDLRYVFFPSFRNYLAALVEGNESGVFRFGASGAETVDFHRARTLFRKYGSENPR
jgi:cell wall assembly regulator SMI1